MTGEGDSHCLRTCAAPEDREAVGAILRSTAIFYDREIAVADELLLDRLDKGEGSDYSFVFADGIHGLEGFLCYGPIAVTDRRFDLYWLAVHRSRQGKGTGGLLLKEAEAAIAVSGGAAIFVETSSRPVYEPARRFYEHHGYREAARVAGYYADGDHKVIFTKRLASKEHS